MIFLILLIISTVVGSILAIAVSTGIVCNTPQMELVQIQKHVSFIIVGFLFLGLAIGSAVNLRGILDELDATNSVVEVESE